jgi:hypothetical protein
MSLSGLGVDLGRALLLWLGHLFSQFGGLQLLRGGAQWLPDPENEIRKTARHAS